MEPRRPRPTVTPRREFVRVLAVVALLALGGRGEPCAYAADAPAAPQPPPVAPAAPRPARVGTVVVRALRASGRPIVGAFVFGYGAAPDGGLLVRRTDATGTVRFGGVRYGDIVVRVVDETPGYAPLDEARVAPLEFLHSAWVDGRLVTRVVESPRCEVEVTGTCRRVLGMVLTEGSRDVIGADVRLFPCRRELDRIAATPGLRGGDRAPADGIAVTDGKGRFDVCSDVEHAILEARNAGGRRGWARLDGVRAILHVAPEGIVRCTGRVVDEVGAAVVGATVTSADGLEGIVDVAASTTVTGDDGAFALDVPCLDSTMLEVSLPGSAPQTFELPRRAGPSDAPAFVVSRTTAVRVVVVDDATGAPVAGASVALAADPPAFGATGVGPGPEPVGTTGADGAVRFPVPPGARVRVRVEASEHGVGEKHAGARARGAVAAIEGDLDAGVARGEERRVVLRLRRPTRVTGSLVAPQGLEAPAGTFTVRLAARSSPRFVTHRAAVGADGTFGADVHEPVVIEGVEAPGFAWRVEPGTAPTALGVVRLTPFGVWSGRVHDADGRGVRNATVRVVGRRAGTAWVRALATTDANGAFLVPMAAGMTGLRAVASAPEHGIGVVPLVDAAPGGEVPVAMLVVPDAQEARFRVLDASGAPLAGVVVARGGRAQRATHDPIPITDAFGLVALRPPEDGVVTLTAPDGARYRFEVGTTGPEPVEVRLPAARAVTVNLAPWRTTDSSFAFVEVRRGAVEPTDARLRPVFDVPIDAARVVVPGLGAGPVRLTVVRAGFLRADVEVPAGATEVTVPLEPVTDAHRARAAVIDAELAGLPPLETIVDETARAAEARRRDALQDEMERSLFD